MGSPLKQSTATVVILGPFLDDADGKTAETALTVGSIDIDLYKHEATSVSTSITATASGGSNDMVHIANGYYSLELTTGNTDTLGRLRVTANISGALPVWHDFEVYPANVYDSLHSTDRLQVDTVEVSGTSQTARDLGASVLLSSGTGTGQISLSSGAVTVGTVNDKTGYSLSTTPPTASAIASQVRTELTTELARIDAAISSRSTYAGADTAGTTTLLSRLTSTRAGYLDNLSGGAVALASALTTVEGKIDTVDTVVDAILDDTGTSGVVVASGSKTGYSLATAPPTANEVADAVLGRNASNVETTAGEHTLSTIILATLESSVSGTTWTIKGTDGSTTRFTKTVTTNASADPITGVS